MTTYITVKEFANRTGFAEITVRQWIQHGKIKSFKAGHSRRIPEEEIERLMKGDK